MKVKIKFFAQCRELTGRDKATLELKRGTTVTHLKSELSKRFPSFSQHLDTLLIAVNGELADPDQVLSQGDEVALLPPFGGG